MSTIGVKYHNEDIHNIIHKPMSSTIKSPRYKSKRSRLLRAQQSGKGKYNGHQTFGLAHYDAPESWNYLKKGKPRIEIPPIKAADKKEVKCVVDCKPSPPPKCNVENPKGSGKNYVKENIKKIAEIQPKVPCPKKVVTPRGTVKEMAHLLQMIKIRQSEEYGRIPKYLCKRRMQWAKEKQRKEQEKVAVENYKVQMGIGTMGMGENVYMIDQETRQKLLDGLKENWNELSKQFLKLPVMSDTLPKIRRRMWLEREIDQLERDVKLVETHPYIYLERNDCRPYAEIVTEEMKRGETEEKKREKMERDKQKQSETGNQQQDEAEEEQTTEKKDEEKKEEDEELKTLN